jgi:hypothetical protein
MSRTAQACNSSTTERPGVYSFVDAIAGVDVLRAVVRGREMIIKTAMPSIDKTQVLEGNPNRFMPA